MAGGWQCIKIGSAAVAKIVPIAPWMIAAYIAVHPLPADCDRTDCHFVIPREEFLPGGMFAPGKDPAAPPEKPKPQPRAESSPGGEEPGTSQWAEGPFWSDFPLPTEGESSPTAGNSGHTRGTGGTGTGGGGVPISLGGFTPTSPPTRGGTVGGGTGGPGSPPISTPLTNGNPGGDPPSGGPPTEENPPQDTPVTPVPEPATMPIVAAGVAIVALLLLRRRASRT